MASPVHLGSRQFVIVTFTVLVTIFSCDVFCAANNVKNAAVAQFVDKKDVMSPGPADASIWVSYTKEDNGLATCSDEYSCLYNSLSDNERKALEAIRTLHSQLDDDADGNIDLSESDEFLREELHYEGGHERRQKAFHRNDDMHISVRELWDMWTRSEVHNWTVEQTGEWLAHFVQLPQYVQNFQHHGINGTKLPRLAVNNVQYIGSVLGIKDPIHRQKIAVKAMDVVLFGPPKEVSSHFKDVTLITLLVCAVVGGLYTYRTNSNSKKHLTKLMEHMEILSSAEKELQELQVKLQAAKQEQDITLSEKMQLERKLEQESNMGSNSNLQQYNADPVAELELRRLREEVDILRSELQRAEGELEDRLCWSPPPELQHWLQLTYELEQRVYNKKRLQAEKQLEQAKDACEKLNRKRSSFVASFVSTHGRTIDDVDKSIMEARSSLMEVKQDLQERTTRWRQIETLCGFPITTNPGLNYLETLLRSGLSSASSRYVVLNAPRHGTTFDEDMDETGSLVSSCAAAGPPVAAAAALLPYLPESTSAGIAAGRCSSRSSAQAVFARKYPLPKRDSSISLESASALINHMNGNGLSAHSISMSDLPAKTTSVANVATTILATQRYQKLSQRENSKDSAFDGSTVSSIGGESDDGSASATRSSSSGTATATVPAKMVTIPAPVKVDPSSSPGPIHKTHSPSSDRLSSLSANHSATESSRKSPSLISKLNPRRSTQPVSSKASTSSQDSSDASITTTIIKSDSALEEVFQQAQQQEQQPQDSNEPEETLSTDSSIPGLTMDDEARKSKKKKFHFPSFGKRIKINKI